MTTVPELCSTAAIGMFQRRGVRRVRHLDVWGLAWQSFLRDGRIKAIA